MAPQRPSSTRPTIQDNSPRQAPQKRPALPLLFRNPQTGKYTSIASSEEGKLLKIGLNDAATLKRASYLTSAKQVAVEAQPSSASPLTSIQILDIHATTPNKATASDPLGLQTEEQVAAWGNFTMNQQARKLYRLPITKVTKTGRIMCEGNQFSHGKAYKCEKIAPKEKRSSAFKNAMKGKK